jgi:hypothetical protein
VAGTPAAATATNTAAAASVHHLRVAAGFSSSGSATAVSLTSENEISRRRRRRRRLRCVSDGFLVVTRRVGHERGQRIALLALGRGSPDPARRRRRGRGPERLGQRRHLEVDRLAGAVRRPVGLDDGCRRRRLFDMARGVEGAIRGVHLVVVAHRRASPRVAPGRGRRRRIYGDCRSRRRRAFDVAYGALEMPHRVGGAIRRLDGVALVAPRGGLTLHRVVGERRQPLRDLDRDRRRRGGRGRRRRRRRRRGDRFVGGAELREKRLERRRRGEVVALAEHPFEILLRIDGGLEPVLRIELQRAHQPGAQPGGQRLEAAPRGVRPRRRDDVAELSRLLGEQRPAEDQRQGDDADLG